MLFTLSNKLTETDFFSPNKSEILRAVENILRSVWEGKHLVFAEIEVIEHFREYITNEDCLSVLIDLELNYSFLNFDKIKYFVNVVPENDTNNIAINNDNIILELSVDYFQQSEITRRTIVLCEDEGDALFYKKIAEYFCNSNNINYVNLNYEEDGGGGRNTYRPFQRYINANNIFYICFSDNDRRYPEANIGDTLREIQNCNNPHHLCKLVELSVHEIENLIPFNFLATLRPANNLQSNGIDYINRLKSSTSSYLLRYFDIKKGISVQKIKNNTDYLNFTETLNQIQDNPINISNIQSLGDEINIIPGVGRTLMKELMNRLYLFDGNIDLLPFQVDEWNKIGSQFVYWCCARVDEPLNT